MAETWGAIALHLTDYKRPSAVTHLKEKALIPDPAATGPQSVLMGVGRVRRRRSASGWASPADYANLEADKEGYVARLVTFNDGFSMNSMILDLDGERKLGMGRVWYTATFIEV